MAWRQGNSGLDLGSTTNIISSRIEQGVRKRRLMPLSLPAARGLAGSSGGCHRELAEGSA
jgi:hypothetical protein